MSKEYKDVIGLIKNHSVKIHNDEYDIDFIFTGVYDLSQMIFIADTIAKEVVVENYSPEYADAMIGYYVMQLSNIGDIANIDDFDVEEYYSLYTYYDIRNLLTSASEAYSNMINNLQRCVYQRIDFLINSNANYFYARINDLLDGIETAINGDGLDILKQMTKNE